MEVRWRVYRFECSHAGCGRAEEQADHHRRDPVTMTPGYCGAHRQRFQFAGSRPLLEVDAVVGALRGVPRSPDLPWTTTWGGAADLIEREAQEPRP